jgi:hypothetical protein
MLAEERLPGWASGHRVIGVGGQTARPIDDVGALTDSGGWVMVQAKKGLSLSSRTESSLADALAQVVEAVVVGVPDRPARENELRPIDPSVDRALVLADDRAPKTIGVSLADVTDRLRTWPDPVPLSEAATNNNERNAQKVLLDHLRRLWRAHAGEQLDDAGLRALLRPLAVRALHLNEDGEHYKSVQVMLSDLLSGQDTGTLWRALEIIGQRLAERQSWIDRASLVAELETQNFVLRPVTRLRPDVERLRRVTADNIESLSESVTVTLPEGAVTLPRHVAQTLVSAEGSFALTGGPGAGKTVLLHSFATSLANQGVDLVLLGAGNLRATAGQTREELNLQHDLGEVLRGWSGSRPGVLVLDGLDQTRGEDASGWLPGLVRHLRGSRWRIVASIRSFDLLHGRRWQAMFRGDPVDPEYADPVLSGVRHLLVRDLSPRELEPLLAASPELADLIETADDRFRLLLANPFNLDIAGQLAADGALREAGQIGNRLDLLDRYWQSRVVSDATASYERPPVLKIMVERMLTDRRQQVGSTAGLPLTGSVLSDLVRDGVLRELPRKPGYPQAPITFAHPVLFDYAVAILALGDVTVAESLPSRLDEDPNLAMVVRPSLDYRLSIAWREDPDRRTFWQLALRLAARSSGHGLAGAAAASTCARELAGAEDLAALAAACIGTSTPSSEQRWNTDDARRLAFLIAAAISTIDSRQTPHDAFGPFIAQLAQHALSNDDVDLALLAAQLLNRAAGTYQPGHETPAARSWVQAGIACMTVALAQPQETGREHLARAAARPLARAAALDAHTAKATIAAVLAPAVLQAWDIEVIRRLIECLPEIAGEVPDLAVEVGASVWELEETRDEKTNLSQSQILPLTSTRVQELDNARYSVSTKFPKVAATNIEAATKLLLRLVETPRLFRWDHSEPSASQPRVRFGDTLEFGGGHRSLPSIVDAFIEELQTAAERAMDPYFTEADAKAAQRSRQALSRVVQLLIEGLTHCEVWQRLLHRAASTESPALAQALTPMMGSELFSHGETWVVAAHLAQRLSAMLEPDEHRSIEAAILTATEMRPVVHDDPAQQDRQLQRRDMILSALDYDKISHVDAQRHLTELVASDRPASPLPPLPLPGRSSIFRQVPDPDPKTEPAASGQSSLRATVQELTGAIQQSKSSDDAASASGLERLISSWQVLSRMLASGQADQSEKDQADLAFVEGALSLTRYPQSAPETELGAQILGALSDALPSATNPPAQDMVHADWHGAWGVTRTTTAIQGIAVLAGRPDWRSSHGDHLTALLKPYLDSPNPVYRLLAAQALSVIFPGQNELLVELERRLTSESNQHVLERLTYELGTDIHVRPLEVDGILKRISSEKRWAVLTGDPEADSALGTNDHTNLGLGYIAILAACHATPYASSTARAWLSQPVDHPERAARVPSWLRGYLNPSETSLQIAQERAFDLLTLSLDQARATWRQLLTEKTISEQQGADLRNATLVAHHVIEQVYYASGAVENKTQSEPTNLAPTDLGQFAGLALLLIESCGEIHHPAVTHHIIETLDHISDVHPKRALLAAAHAVTNDDAYAQESLAVDAGLGLIKRYLADHRDLVLGDIECTTAIRTLLESFVRMGWDQAIQFAESMDDMFR